ncbi:hypothetical protein PoB_005588900 [Plakobranchus ocellatus]|uniref:Uncharacterized protein n=1 Tax=Plakobranchus ocellatus TaxID=259542 RepID=A0AAV4CF59_9GAST|nr:hypothetical protein PoB_005588900 [Plakobranchus ocellatus]
MPSRSLACSQQLWVPRLSAASVTRLRHSCGDGTKMQVYCIESVVSARFRVITDLTGSVFVRVSTLLANDACQVCTPPPWPRDMTWLVDAVWTLSACTTPDQGMNRCA